MKSQGTWQGKRKTLTVFSNTTMGFNVVRRKGASSRIRHSLKKTGLKKLSSFYRRYAILFVKGHLEIFQSLKSL